jgi:hypothetical protein
VAKQKERWLNRKWVTNLRYGWLNRKIKVKQGDGWLNREMGGLAERWVAKQGDG